MSNLKIRDLPGLGQYMVASASRPDAPYMVDLTQRVVDGKAHGACTCMHFVTVCEPNLRRHGKWIVYRKDGDKIRQGVTQCKHIAGAHNHMTYHITMSMLAKLEKGVPHE